MTVLNPPRADAPPSPPRAPGASPGGVADKRLPRYLQIRDDLVRRIGENHWPAGKALPAEDKLAAQYGVATGTLRKALDVLVSDGLVERLHGRGTFVLRAFERSSMLRFVRFREVGESQLPEARILNMRAEIPPSAVAAKLGLGPRAKALYINRTRSYGDDVILVEHIWLPLPRFAKLAPYLARHPAPLLYPIYEAECGVLVCRALDSLSIEPLAEQDAAVFAVPAQTLAAKIERTMLDHGGNVVEWRRSHVPTDRFSYNVEIR